LNASTRGGETVKNASRAARWESGLRDYVETEHKLAEGGKDEEELVSDFRLAGGGLLICGGFDGSCDALFDVRWKL